jgi:hypothetical protein
MPIKIRSIVIQNTDDIDRSILIDNPEGIIFDPDDPDQFTKVFYFKKHGAKACIEKYGKSTRRIYEHYGLEYPGDPIYNSELPE